MTVNEGDVIFKLHQKIHWIEMMRRDEVNNAYQRIINQWLCS